MSVALLAKFAARIAELETAIYRRRHDLPTLRLAPPDVVGPQAPHPDWPATGFQSLATFESTSVKD